MYSWCLVALLNAVLILVSVAKVEKYQLKFDRFEDVYPDRTICDGNVTNRKFNRTTLLTNIYIEGFKWLNPGDVKMKILGYRWLSNTFRLTALQFELDYCTILSSKQFGMDAYNKNTNIPGKCPVPPGVYYMKDILVDTNMSNYVNTVPPNFVGKWKIAVEFQRQFKTYLIYNLYFTTEVVPQW